MKKEIEQFEFKGMQSVKNYRNINQADDLFEHSLKKGIYDIDYVLNLLRTILDKTNSHLLNPRDLQFSLKISCEKLIKSLEYEKNQCSNPMTLFTCVTCKESEVIPKSTIKHHQCENCRHKAYSIELQ